MCLFKWVCVCVLLLSKWVFKTTKECSWGNAPAVSTHSTRLGVAGGDVLEWIRTKLKPQAGIKTIHFNLKRF